MHGELVKEVEKKAGISTAEHRQQGASKASFKGAANTAQLYVKMIWPPSADHVVSLQWLGISRWCLN
jgi:hypothetical protein